MDEDKKTIKRLMRDIRAIKDSRIQYYVDGNLPYSYVRVTMKGTTFGGTGFAKCSPKDEYSLTRGTTIAEGRAIKDLAQTLLTHGYLTLDQFLATFELTKADVQ